MKLPMVIDQMINNLKMKMMLMTILLTTPEATMVLLMFRSTKVILLNSANLQSQENHTVMKLPTEMLLMIKNSKIKMIIETKLLMIMVLLINGKEREILLKSLVNKVKYNSYNNNTETILVNLENYQVTKLLMVTQLKTKNLRTKMIQKMTSSITMVSSTNGKIMEILLNYQDHLLLKFKRLENSNIFTDNIKCI